MTISELIEALEKSEGPDLELDHEIYRVLGLRPKSGPFPRIPNYTASIDSALSLVPEGCAWQVRRNCSADGDVIYCNAQVWRFHDPRDEDAPTYWANSGPDRPAIALTIAALRAITAGRGER